MASCSNAQHTSAPHIYAGWLGCSVSPARQLLAVYPLLLLYATIGWLALVKG